MTIQDRTGHTGTHSFAVDSTTVSFILIDNDHTIVMQVTYEHMYDARFKTENSL